MPETPKRPWKRVTTETLIASLSPQAAAVPARQDAVGEHQARKLYQGRASFEFIKNGVFQTDGFAVLVNTHSIAECEDSEVADWICKQWNAEVKREEERLLSQPCGACGGSRLSHEARGAYDHEWVSRQDAVPDAIEWDEEDERMTPTQPTQAAVGEGELPADKFAAMDEACLKESLERMQENLDAAHAETREAIAQRDEARKELNCPKCDGKGCYECQSSGSQVRRLTAINAELCASHNTLLQDAANQQRRAEAAEAKLAALDVPKLESEEIERLIVEVLRKRTGLLDYRAGQIAKEVLSRLRSLPSEPGSGVQRKAVENG